MVGVLVAGRKEGRRRNLLECFLRLQKHKIVEPQMWLAVFLSTNKKIKNSIPILREQYDGN